MTSAGTKPAEKTYKRFSVPQRLEHWLLFLSFTVLAVTGLPQKFAGDGWAETLIAWFGGIEVVRFLHHTAALVLLLECIYHVVAVAHKILVLRVRWTMFPQLQDAKDALDALLHNLGARKPAPRLGRFSFAEKAEYWALVWGTVIMALTGFMLWNPIMTSRLLPGDIIPAAKAAHGAEAILAVLAIVTWHFYNVHLKSFNTAMFKGSLSAHEMAEEHALELDEREHEGAQPPRDLPRLRRRERVFVPVATVLSLLLLFGVFVFTSAETTAVTTIPVPASRGQVYVPQTPTPTPTRAPTSTPVPTATRVPDVTAAPNVTAAPTAPPPAGGVAKVLPANHAGRVTCQVCHATGVGGAPKNPDEHAGRLDAVCRDCHKSQ